ncbi:hypothetical protein L7F22_020303 [Adiantum nelumboides]|nr:hypothetical protein [Adiantum nelumboides]
MGPSPLREYIGRTKRSQVQDSSGSASRSMSGCFMASTCSGYIASILFISLFSSALLLMLMAPTAAQPGFISIDCGGAEPFVTSTNLSWVTDDGYITSGKAAEVNDSADVAITSQTVRYFPEKTPKNCYELMPVQEGRGYIVRAYFHYGNFDGEDKMPQFSLIVDATVMVSAVRDGSYYEMYVPAKSDIISVCLARNVSSLTGDPFISTLELRTLPLNTTYDTVAFSQGYGLFRRYSVDLGSDYLYIFRYPNDTLDRRWVSDEVPANSTASTTHEIVVSQEKNADFGPPGMLQSALTGTNLSYSITMVPTTVSSDEKYLVTMHFSEISPNVTRSGQRVFDIYSNVWQQGSEPWAANVDIYNMSGGQFMGLELYGAQPVTPVNNSIVISFKSSPNSSHNPIISGIQVLLLTEDPLSNLTSADDETPALMYAIRMEESELPQFYPTLYPPHTEPADQMRYLSIVEQIKVWWDKSDALWKEWQQVLSLTEQKQTVKELKDDSLHFKAGMKVWKKQMSVLGKHTNALLQLSIAASKIPKKEIKNRASKKIPTGK